MRSISLLAVLSTSALASTVSTTRIATVCPEKVASAYYAGWHADEFPLDKVSWDKYTHLNYAFAEPTSDVNILDISGSDPDMLPKFVKKAKEKGVKSIISVGGWNGSGYFSTAVASAENRTAFANTITTFVDKYGLDGVNFDWEYPNRQGLGCNTISVNDTANFLMFLQDLRSTPRGADIIVTAAVTIVPFNGPDGSPLSNVSAFAPLFDYLVIMNYDVWGSWSNAVGPNAPLNDTCAPPADQQGSAVSAVKSWTTAGMPVDKLVLGVAFYGHAFRVTNANAFVNGKDGGLTAYPPFNASDRPSGDAWAGTAGGVDRCGAPNVAGDTWDFWALVESGFLTQDGMAAPGIAYRYDECSQTPYVYNATSDVMISYDNAQSMTAKGKFIEEAGLLGFAAWEAAGDYHDELLDAVRAGGNFPDLSLTLVI